MKRNVLPLAMVLTLMSTAQAITWQKTFDGGIGNCVQQASDGNYLVAGLKGLDSWFFKTDTVGNILWEHIGQGGSNWLEETSDGGLILAGIPDMMKTTSNGDSLWAKDFNMKSRCVQELPDGGYVVLGSTSEENEKIIMVRTDENGDSIWSQTFEEPGNNINSAPFIQTTNDGGFIIVGTTGYEDEEYNRWSQLWLIRTNSAGSKLWDRKYGDQEWNETNEGFCVRQTSDNGYIIAGAKTPGGFWLIKTNDVGDTLWTRTYGGEYCNNVVITSDGNYVAVGRGTATNVLERCLPNGGDVLLVKIDSLGNTIWSRNIGGDKVDVGNGVAQTFDGGYIVSGWSGSFVPEGLYLLKTDSLGFVESIAEEPIPQLVHNWEVITSIGQKATLRYWNSPQGFHARVFDVSGREVDIIKANAATGFVSWGEGFPSGVYLIQVIENKKAGSTKIVLVK